MTQTAEQATAATDTTPTPPESPVESLVEIRGVSKTFRDFWYRPKVKAVADLTLSVHRGEVLGLLGPNGSGKSTTIKMILGLLYPTKGKIAVLGKPPTDVSLKKRVGYLPEESNLYRFLDAGETLDFYGSLFKIDGEERKNRIESLLDMVGLQASRYRQVGEMSKGMRRRVALAQALINDPDLLILDEPTSGMDPIATREVKDLILTLKKRGKTIILCTHLLGDVEDVCDRLAIMYGGKLRAEGPADELLNVENRQTVETESLPAEAIDEIKAVLAKYEKSAEVKPSKQRLESLFLDVIREAEGKGEQTTGAAVGGEVAEFLAEGATDDAVLEQLATKPVEPRKVEPATAPEPVKPDEDVLSQVAAKTPEPTPETPAKPIAPPA
ncbi:MAG: ABC transporter ATP-binding protein, partial [Planctomycetota bacterium]